MYMYIYVYLTGPAAPGWNGRAAAACSSSAEGSLDSPGRDHGGEKGGALTCKPVPYTGATTKDLVQPCRTNQEGLLTRRTVASLALWKAPHWQWRETRFSDGSLPIVLFPRRFNVTFSRVRAVNGASLWPMSQLPTCVCGD